MPFILVLYIHMTMYLPAWLCIREDRGWRRSPVGVPLQPGQERWF
jgi:hypothetical protein